MLEHATPLCTCLVSTCMQLHVIHRLVAAEVVVFAAPLVQAPLIGKAGGLLRGLGSVLGEPVSGWSGVSPGTTSNQSQTPLAATHMTGALYCELCLPSVIELMQD